MSSITLSSADSGMTAVPNAFIDIYLPAASGEYVKVYLLLWRCFCAGKDISVPQLADMLDDTEKDVIRAIRYWSGKGLISVSAGGDGEITGIHFINPAGAASPEQRTETETEEGKKTENASGPENVIQTDQLREISQVRDRRVSGTEKKRTLASSTRNALAADEDFGQLVYIAGKYLGEPLGHTGSDILGYLYGELGMSEDLLEYAVETCVDAGHKSLHYIEKIALDWHEKGIDTVDKAREQAVLTKKQYNQILRAFGISGRGPAPEEKKIMDRWIHEYGFSMDIILEACARTIRNVHDASFDYAGGILADWKKNNVKSMADITALDEKFQKEQDKKGSSDGGHNSGGRGPANRFHNFDEVGYDMDAIVRELNANG